MKRVRYIEEGLSQCTNCIIQGLVYASVTWSNCRVHTYVMLSSVTWWIREFWGLTPEPCAANAHTFRAKGKREVWTVETVSDHVEIRRSEFVFHEKCCHHYHDGILRWFASISRRRRHAPGSTEKGYSLIRGVLEPLLYVCSSLYRDPQGGGRYDFR